MKTNKFLAVIGMTVALLATSLNLNAQTPVTGGGGSEKSIATGPTVPIDVAIKGRQAITTYLIGQVDHVDISFSGNSVVGPDWRNHPYLDRNMLRQLGYIHDGSFAELSDAIFGIAYSGDVIKTPDGYYDVRATLVYYNSNNIVALNGNGYLNIWRDSNGNLQVGQFQPYVSINETINIVVPGEVDAAKWVGNNGRSQNLNTSWDGKNTTISLSSGNLENGYLLFADGNGHITGYDLTSGATLSGQFIYAILGQIQSGDVEVLRNPQTINAGYNEFSLYGEQIVGRFPLRDIVSTGAIAQVISFSVPIWGSTQGLAPSHIYVTPIYMNGKSQMIVGQEYELPQKSGSFFLIAPAGEYDLRTEFDGLTDWEEINVGYLP